MAEGKINKSCKRGTCCTSCDDKWKSNGERCKNACDNECNNCSCNNSGGYYHDGGWYRDNE